MIRRLISTRLVRFLIGGGVAALFNLLLMRLFVDSLGMDTAVLRNVANLISIECSLILSFFIYRSFVWPNSMTSLRLTLIKQLPLYHASAGTAVITRVLILFPFLDWLGLHYGLNTLVGVLLSAGLNYFLSDRWVFKDSPSMGSEVPHFPEALEPSLGISVTENKAEQMAPKKPIELFSIVMPAFNEEGSIEESLRSLESTLSKNNIPHEILVINDNSKDATKEILTRLSQEFSSIRFKDSYYPGGFGFAIRCGLENFSGDAVAIVMSDGSDAPEDAVLYYEKLQEGYDCVFGSRFIKGGQVIDYPKHKYHLNRAANLFIKMLFGLRLNDTTNAFKAYRREVIQGIQPLISHHFNLTVEIPLKSIVRGYQYTIVPISWKNRKTGVSNLKIKEMGSRYLFIVLSIFLERMLSRGDYVQQHTKKSPRTNEQKEKALA